MDWTNVVVEIAGFLLTGGGLAALVTLKDKKSEAVLGNISKVLENSGESNEEWKKISDEKDGIAAGLKADIEALKADVERKDRKVDELYKELSVMRDKADKLGSKVAYLTTMKCKVIGCPNRVPPFGSPDAKANGEAREAK